MLNLATSRSARIHIKKIKLFNATMNRIENLEDKIRSNYGISDIKIRTTSKVCELIWQRVDFIEFDRQWWPRMGLNLTGSKLHLKLNQAPPISKKRAIYPEGKGFLYCRYKCVDVKSQEKLILIEKYPILKASGRSRSKTIRALNTLSKMLGCSKELKNISMLLKLFWTLGTVDSKMPSIEEDQDAYKV